MNFAIASRSSEARILPTASARRQFNGVLFRKVLDDTTKTASTYEVRSGDTLSGVVHRHLRASGEKPSSTEIYAGVKHVSRANGIRNPDKIHPGQIIDLSDLAEARAPRTEKPAAVDRRTMSFRAEKNPWGRIVGGEAVVSSRFGMRSDPITGERRMHRGVDIAAMRGTPIHAPERGRVTFSGPHGAHGNAVIVRHANGVQTLYAHLSENSVRAGEEVSSGTQLGRVGSTGRSTGPHLHFEVLRDGRHVDPLSHL